MAKRYDEEVEVRVEADAGMPAAFVWRGRRYEVADVIGRWRIEGRWWADGRDREYWRVEARGGAVWDLYHDRKRGRWHMAEDGHAVFCYGPVVTINALFGNPKRVATQCRGRSPNVPLHD